MIIKGSVVADSPLLYVLITIGLIGVVIFALVCAKKSGRKMPGAWYQQGDNK